MFLHDSPPTCNTPGSASPVIGWKVFFGSKVNFQQSFWSQVRFIQYSFLLDGLFCSLVNFHVAPTWTYQAEPWVIIA